MKTKLKAITRIFIPNRGEIACRLIAACKQMQITPILGFSAIDRNSKAARLVEEKICIGPAEAQSSYLDIDAVISSAQKMRADALHPGYGFLAENDQLVRACKKAQIIFIGPSAEAMRKLGDKIEAKKLALKLKVPTLTSFTLSDKEARADKPHAALQSFLKKTPLPLLVKAAAGGGGRGMRIIDNQQNAFEQIQAASREAEAFFKDGSVFIEPYVSGARHVEIQILADAYGLVKAIGSRDCSLQRRHQKIIEEAPANILSAKQEKALFNAAEKIVAAANYQGLATVEFLVSEKKLHYFLEVNTRLQVEHPVTELSLDIDLVRAQIDIACGKPLESILTLMRKKPLYAIEARICAEKPEADFQASTGRINSLIFPSSSKVRIDSGFEILDSVSHYYDSLIAKVIAVGETRRECVETLRSAISETTIAPLPTNLTALTALLENDYFLNDTHSLLTTAQILTPLSAPYEKQQLHGLIAAAVLKTKISAYDRNPWHTLGSWSLSAPVRSLLHLRIDKTIWQVLLEKLDQRVFVSLSRAGTEISSGYVTDLQRAEREFSFSFNGESINGSVFIANSDLYVIKITPNMVNVEFIAPEKLRKHSIVNTDKNFPVYAHLPGKIVKLFVSVGSVISEGTALFVIESMKMEHTVVAEKAGVILQQACTQLSLVNAGDLVYVIDTHSGTVKN
jgi:acetyl/propionyl-CoA carboxylase alpha subunit